MEEDTKKVQARIVLEMMGSPQDYVEQTFKKVIEAVKAEQKYTVLHENNFPAEQKEQFWSIFSEMEMEFKDLAVLMGFCFDYMPSSVEIIEPQTLPMKAGDVSGLLNDLQAHLHKLEMLMKNLSAQNKVLNTNLLNLLRNTIVISLKEKPKNLRELSLDLGVKPEQFKEYIDEYMNKGLIKEVDGKYQVAI
ncbi:hypothetical protein HZB02_04505 [Candidatus Woesearchaeota archaeon]|nr:hypothetical protein [Candidatus Woesearchaeota archaeon]